MKKVLVLTYSYYPIFHGGVPRVAAFCKYLQLYGWTPILLAHDSRSDSHFAKTNKPDTCEVIRIDAKEKVITNKLLRIFAMAVKFIRHSLEDMGFISFEKELLKAAREICQKEDIDVILASSLPQCVHRVAFKLSKEFNIPWVADHRDLVGQDLERNIKHKLLFKLDRYRVIKRDSKYDRAAQKVVTVSQGLADLIKKRAGCDALVIPNGFDEDDFKDILCEEKNGKFTMVYTGSLFGNSNIHLLLDALLMATHVSKNFKEKAQIEFFGPCCTSISEILKQDTYQPLTSFVFCRGSVSHEDAIRKICEADVLYLISHPAKGIATGKLYEYLAAQKTILSAPGDGDITDQIIEKTSSGYVARNKEELCEKLLFLFAEWEKYGKIAIKHISSEVLKYNRKHQTKDLARVLDVIVDSKTQ